MTPDQDFSNPRKYFTTSKKSFCEYITIDGTRQAKYNRQTQLKIPDAIIEVCEENCFRGPVCKEHTRFTDEYDSWERICTASYYDYAKKLCEQYRFCVKKYRLCVAEKRYIGISKSDFIALKEDLTFLKNCMKTVLRDYKEYFDERFVHGLSIRKYAKAHNLNRGNVDYMQRKFFSVLAGLLHERDVTDGKNRLIG